MKKMIALMMLMLLFAMPAFAEGELGTIVQSSCSIVQSDGYYLAYCFAQVHNNTDQVLCLDEGMFYLTGGEETIASEEVSQIWPQFIAPGGEGYLFDVVPFEALPQITGLNYDVRYLEINPAYAGVTLETTARVELDDASGLMSVVCEIGNGASITAFDPTVVVGLYTEAGQLVYCDGRSLKGVGIPADGKLLMRFDVESTLVEQWMSYNALPTQVRAEAMFRTGSD